MFLFHFISSREKNSVALTCCFCDSLNRWAKNIAMELIESFQLIAKSTTPLKKDAANRWRPKMWRRLKWTHQGKKSDDFKPIWRKNTFKKKLSLTLKHLSGDFYLIILLSFIKKINNDKKIKKQNRELKEKVLSVLSLRWNLSYSSVPLVNENLRKEKSVFLAAKLETKNFQKEKKIFCSFFFENKKKEKKCSIWLRILNLRGFLENLGRNC